MERISVYTQEACQPCKATVRALGKHSLQYDLYPLETHQKELLEFIEQGHTQAPVVVTEDETWSGFRYDKIKSLAQKQAEENLGVVE